MPSDDSEMRLGLQLGVMAINRLGMAKNPTLVQLVTYGADCYRKALADAKALRAMNAEPRLVYVIDLEELDDAAAKVQGSR